MDTPRVAPADRGNDPLLEVRDLKVTFAGRLGLIAGLMGKKATDARAVDGLISVSRTLGFRLTPIGEVTDRRGSVMLRANGAEWEMPVYESDEITRVLGEQPSN